MRKSVTMAVAFAVSLILLSCSDAQEIPRQETEALDFAQGLLSRGLYDMAANEYQKFIANYPQSTYLEEANLAVGESYFLSRDYPRALDAFNHFKQLFPNSDKFSTAILRLGQIAIDQKKYDEAIAGLTSIDPEKLLKGQPLQAFDFYIGKAYRGKGDSATASTYFQKASEIADATAYTAYAFQEIGEIDTQNARYKEAIESYRKAIALAAEDNLKGLLTARMGEAQFLSGDYLQAMGSFHQVIDQYPSNEVVKDTVTNLLLTNYNVANYDQLLVEYKNNATFIKDEGAYFNIHFTALRAYIELGKYDQALLLLEKIFSLPDLKDEDKQKAVLKKAAILIKQKKYQDGVALLENSAGKTPDESAEILFLKAQGYYGLGDFTKASQFFQEVKKSGPDSKYMQAAVLGMAHASQEAGNYKEAADLFLEYARNGKDEKLKSEALYDAVLMAIKLNTNDQAVMLAEEYLKTYPKGDYYEQSLLLLGDLYAKSNQSEKAVALLQEYLAHPEIKRLDAVNFLLGYNLQLLGRSDQALEIYARVTNNKDDPKFYSFALKNSAVMSLSQKKDLQAAAFFDRVIFELDKNPLEFKTYLWICGVYLKEKKFNDVLRLAEKTEKDFPGQGSEDIAYYKAESYRELKDFDNAQKFYDAVLATPAKNKDSAAAHFGKGLALFEQNKFDEAKAEFQKAIEDNPEDHTVALRSRFELGNVEAAQKHFDAALKYYLLVGTIYDDDSYVPESLLRAGGALENLNRKDEAAKLYHQILDKYKDSPVAVAARERIASLK